MATAEGVFSCAAIRRLPDDEPYDPACLEIVKTTYRDDVLGGASSTPVSVRFSDTNAKNVDTEPVAQPFVPRRTRLSPDDFRKYGLIVGCQ